MKTEIRKAHNNDIDTILQCMADYYCIEDVPFDMAKSKKTLENFLSCNNAGVLCIVQYESEPVGYYCLTFGYTLENYGKDCFLDELYIKPAFRHKGVGSEVLKHIESYLERNKFKALHLIVSKKNRSAYRYYLKNGFTVRQASFMSKLLKSKQE